MSSRINLIIPKLMKIFSNKIEIYKIWLRRERIKKKLMILNVKIMKMKFKIWIRDLKNKKKILNRILKKDY